MDVGFYLGELLMQQGEVSVPGLGYFVQVRVSGYYDENERKFYPPYHQAQFDVQSIDDDALAEYIAAKKNISVASAKYFAEKYIANLKQQALITEVAIGNLGTFYTELTRLTFRPADKIIDDTIFYGFEPVSISKAGDTQPVDERPKVELNYPPKVVPQKPAITEEYQAPVEEPVAAAPAPPVYQEEESGISHEFFDPNTEEEEEVENRGPLRLILTVLIGVIVIGLGVFALYRYQPDTFAKIAFWQHNKKVVDTIKPKPVVVTKVDTAAADTTKVDTTATKQDTVAAVTTQPVTPAKKKQVIISQTVVPAAVTKKKETVITQPAVTNKTVVTQPAAINKPAVAKPASTKPVTEKVLAGPGGLLAKPSDAVGTRRYEVEAFRCATVAEANAAIKKMKKAGLDPRIITDAPGTLYHISIGHFATKQEATDFAFNAIEGNKVPGGNAYGIEIIPQK